jgi:acetolactate synthase-1/2/3 large subunit
MRVVDAIADWFAEVGVEHYFGYAGGAIWPFMDALIDHPEMEGVQTKHEEHAVHAADIYYRTTGKVAPVLVTKGPGILNCVSGIATAMHDQSAVMLLAGSGSTHLLGKGTMQELYYNGFEDSVNVLRPITKGSWLVVRPDTVIDVLNQAYKTAISGRKGPVFVQLPLDIQLGLVEGEVEGPARRTIVTRSRPARGSIQRTVELLRDAERPLIVAGGGLAQAGGHDELRSFVEDLGIPAASTLTAKGILPEDHPLALGPTGRSGTQAAVNATRRADVVLAIGARFSDNHTSQWRKGKIYDVTKTKIVQVNIEPDEVARNFPVEVGIASDAVAFLEDLGEALAAAGFEKDWSAWRAETESFKEAWREKLAPVVSADGEDGVHPGRLAYEVGEMLGDHGRVFIDVGDVIQYAEPYMTVRRHDAWHITPGMAQMSWAVSGVLGAVAADPSRPAIALTGDGAFNMASNVLATAVEYDLPAIWVILNNAELGIERKGSEGSFGRGHPWNRFVRKDTGEPYNPDFVKLAEANGALGERVERAADLPGALRRAIASRRPYVVDVKIDVAPGSYFVEGVDRNYPDTWSASYPAHGSMTLAR